MLSKQEKEYSLVMGFVLKLKHVMLFLLNKKIAIIEESSAKHLQML